ncbi:hypothetical protein ACSDR0_50360 [Streptosporangium sp. G11]|uniref:hypothetical protein n=1 Tax=Streptosporangium sp. G11 TaxID=3436926 RepID=UPI003EB85D8E
MNRRPATLTSAVAAAIAAAGLNLIGAIAILTSSMDVVKEQIAASATSSDGPVTPEMVDTGSERATNLVTIYTSMAYATIFWSLVLVLLAWLALRGGRATRVFSALILAFSLLMKAADLFIAIPTLTLIADVPFVVLALAAIVLFFMPASNAYRKTR